jgi:hypothetical protein
LASLAARVAGLPGRYGGAACSAASNATMQTLALSISRERLNQMTTAVGTKPTIPHVTDLPYLRSFRMHRAARRQQGGRGPGRRGRPHRGDPSPLQATQQAPNEAPSETAEPYYRRRGSASLVPLSALPRSPTPTCTVRTGDPGPRGGHLPRADEQERAKLAEEYAKSKKAWAQQQQQQQKVKTGESVSPMLGYWGLGVAGWGSS